MITDGPHLPVNAYARNHLARRIVGRTTSTDDVVAAVLLARRSGRELRVLGLDPEPLDGAVVLDFARMDAVTVNPHVATVRAQAGATWAQVDGATLPHGLVVPAATSPADGVPGALADDPDLSTRPYGPARASLVEATLVLPDGRVVAAGAGEHRPLLDAVRRGARAGVVTSFLFQAVARA